MKIIIKNSDVQFQTLRTEWTDLVTQLDESRTNSSNPPIADDGTFDYQYGELIGITGAQPAEKGTVEYSAGFRVTRFIELPNSSLKLQYIGKAEGTAGFCIYDSNKNLIGAINGLDARQGQGYVLENYTLNLPSDAKYVRATVGAAYIASRFHLKVEKIVV